MHLRCFLIKPINELMRIINEITQGNMNQCMLIKIHNQIGQMVKGLQHVQNSLEKKIHCRTNKLQNTQIHESESVSSQLRQPSAFQNAILNSSNFSIVSTNLDGTIVSCNATTEKMLGYQVAELVNRCTLAVFHDAAELAARAEKLSTELGRVIESGFEVFVAKTDQGADENEWTYIRKDGSRFPVWVSVTNILNEEQEKIGYLSIASDMTEQKRITEELQIAYNAIEHTREGIVITDSNGLISYINPAYTRIMGYECNEVIGKNPSHAKSGLHDKAFYQAFWDKIHTEGCWEGEIWDKRKDGSLYPEWLSVSCIKDNQGSVAHYVGIFMDISQQKAAEERLTQLAFYDPLTQLPNRALFRERLTQELLVAKRNQHQAALFFIDLDRFKSVNDNLGHDVGDELLIAVATRIKKQIRETDSVCRLGGDEFTIILCELADTSKLSTIAQSIVAALQIAFELKGQQVFIGASIGISIFPQDGDDFDTLVKYADIAMYEAKNAGRGTYRFYQSKD